MVRGHSRRERLRPSAQNLKLTWQVARTATYKDPVIAWNFARSHLLAKSLSGLHPDVPSLKPRKETRHSSHGLDVTVLVVSALETGAIQVTYSVVLATGGQHPSFSRDQYWEPIGAQNWASDCPEVRLSRNGR